MRSRERRRRDQARMKHKARRLYPWDRAAKDANHLCVCSCMMCGNARRHFGTATRQEQKAALAYELAAEELGG